MFASTFLSDSWPCFSTVLTPLFSSLLLPYRYLPSMTMPAFVLFSRHFKANMLTVSLDWVIFPKRFVWDVGCFLTLGHLAGYHPLTYTSHPLSFSISSLVPFYQKVYSLPVCFLVYYYLLLLFLVFSYSAVTPREQVPRCLGTAACHRIDAQGILMEWRRVFVFILFFPDKERGDSVSSSL